MKDIGILDDFDGYAVHDHYSSYYKFDLYHVACNAHQLRELIHAYEEHQQQWAQKMISFLATNTGIIKNCKARPKSTA